MNIESVIPILYSDDILRSIKYYKEVLGFKEHWCWGEEPTFGGVVDGDTTIFFCRGDQGHKGTWLALNVDDVDKYYEAIKAKGAVILSEPDTKPWFMREMLVTDPDGHMLRIGHNTNCK
jgi:uncharacterized glyoxalase superfamily protein PhnB